MAKKTVAASVAAETAAPVAASTPVVNPTPAAAPAETAAVTPAETAAPKEVGKIQKIILMHIAGWPNKDIIAAGYNKSTVAIQTSERKKDPAGYDQKHGIAEAATLFTAPVYVAPAPAPVAAPVAAPAPLAAEALEEEVAMPDPNAELDI